MARRKQTENGHSGLSEVAAAMALSRKMKVQSTNDEKCSLIGISSKVNADVKLSLRLRVEGWSQSCKWPFRPKTLLLEKMRLLVWEYCLKEQCVKYVAI